MNISYLNFWIDLNDLFDKIQESEYIDASVLYEKLTINIIDETRISIFEHNQYGNTIQFTKLEDKIYVEDKFNKKEYEIKNLNRFLKDVQKSLFECATEVEAVSFLKLCSNDTNFLKLKDIPYPEIFSLPSKTISLIEEYF